MNKVLIAFFTGGFIIAVGGSLIHPGFAVAGGILVGYALGVLHTRSALHDALKRAQGLPRL